MKSILLVITRFIYVFVLLGVQYPLISTLTDESTMSDDLNLNNSDTNSKYNDLLAIMDNLNIEKNPVILFTNARNENHMKEWAAHHLLLGFDLIYIFDHKSDNPLKEEFQDFDSRVIVERCDLENPVKLPLMAKAASMAQEMDASWLLYIDADEFLVLNDYSDVKSLLDDYPHADSIGINWLFFGSNHYVEEPKGMILENYTKSELCLNIHVKSFTRPAQIVGVTNPHFYCIQDPIKMFSINNQIICWSPCFNHWPIEFFKAPAYFAHYVYQSEKTYKKRKVLTPRDDMGGYRDEIPDIHLYFNDCDNFDPRNKYAEQIKNFLNGYSNHQEIFKD